MLPIRRLRLVGPATTQHWGVPLSSCSRGASTSPYLQTLDTSGQSKGLPPLADRGKWASIGTGLIEAANKLDMGPAAIEETFAARQQLEDIIRSCDYGVRVHIYGGMTVLNLLEVGGDVDFVAVGDSEPTQAEASEMVIRISREMRRVGLRASGIHKARIPVIKVDRTSFSLPGTPLPASARSAVFQITQPMPFEVQESFAKELKAKWEARSVTWSTPQLAVAEFSTPTDAVRAISYFRSYKGIEIPLRNPLDAREGPELFRYPFDLTLNTTGLINSHAFHVSLSNYPFARHFLMMVKKWGRSSGVINTMDGLLSSYAMTVMTVHYLIRAGVIPELRLKQIVQEPHLLPLQPVYTPLEGVNDGDPALFGFLFANFFQYFGYHFDYAKEIVCTTAVPLEKSRIPQWNPPPPLETGELAPRPPFYNFCIKDPFNVENIARNLTEDSVRYVQAASELAIGAIKKDLHDPRFLVHSLTEEGPRPVRSEQPRWRSAGRPTPTSATGGNPASSRPSSAAPSENSQGVSVENPIGAPSMEFDGQHVDSERSQVEEDARRMLAKNRFHQRQTEVKKFGLNNAKQRENVRAAQDMTRNLVDWMKKGAPIKPAPNASSPPK